MQNFMVSQNNEPTMQTASIRQNYLKVIGVHVYDTVVTEPETRFPVFFFSTEFVNYRQGMCRLIMAGTRRVRTALQLNSRKQFYHISCI